MQSFEVHNRVEFNCEGGHNIWTDQAPADGPYEIKLTGSEFKEKINRQD